MHTSTTLKNVSTMSWPLFATADVPQSTTAAHGDAVLATRSFSTTLTSAPPFRSWQNVIFPALLLWRLLSDFDRLRAQACLCLCPRRCMRSLSDSARTAETGTCKELSREPPFVIMFPPLDCTRVTRRQTLVICHDCIQPSAVPYTCVVACADSRRDTIRYLTRVMTPTPVAGRVTR